MGAIVRIRGTVRKVAIAPKETASGESYIVTQVMLESISAGPAEITQLARLQRAGVVDVEIRPTQGTLLASEDDAAAARE